MSREMDEMRLRDRILKEMVTDLDEVQRRFRNEIYADLTCRKLKPEFERMTLGELLSYIEGRIKAVKDAQ